MEFPQLSGRVLAIVFANFSVVAVNCASPEKGGLPEGFMPPKTSFAAPVAQALKTGPIKIRLTIENFPYEAAKPIRNLTWQSSYNDKSGRGLLPISDLQVFFGRVLMNLGKESQLNFLAAPPESTPDISIHIITTHLRTSYADRLFPKDFRAAHMRVSYEYDNGKDIKRFQILTRAKHKGANIVFEYAKDFMIFTKERFVYVEDDYVDVIASAFALSLESFFRRLNEINR